MAVLTPSSSVVIDLRALRTRFGPATHQHGLALSLGQRVPECDVAPRADEPHAWQIEGLVQPALRRPCELTAEGTIEERMLARQERKAQLAQGVLSGAAGGRQPLLTEADVQELLQPLGHGGSAAHPAMRWAGVVTREVD